MKKFMALFFILILFGCVQENPNLVTQEFIVENSSSFAEESSFGILKGASLSPKSYEENDFIDFFEKAGEVGEIVMWAGDWKELEGNEGSPIVITELAPTYGYIPLIEVTPQSDGELIRPLDPETKESYKNSAVAFADKYKPMYLGLGIEVNSIYENSQKDFEEFVLLYNEIYDAVKEKSPDTKVFTVFQLEKMKGLTLWSTDPYNPDKVQWWMIDEFNTDIVVFTTYPGLVHKDPSEIPEEYYSEIKEYTNKPIAFTEIGWHSAASPAGWESSETEQAEFIEKFFTLTKELNTEIMIWSFLYDQNTIEPFNSMGLYCSNGNAKQSLDAWTDGK